MVEDLGVGARAPGRSGRGRGRLRRRGGGCRHRGAGGAARAALRLGGVRAAARTADVPEGAQIRQELFLRLAHAGARGDHRLARRPDVLVRGDRPGGMSGGECRIDRLHKDATGHLFGGRQPEQIQERRGDIEQRRPRRQPGAPRAGAAQDEDAVLAVPLDRLLRGEGEDVGGAIGAGLEAVIGDDHDGRPRPGGPEDPADQIVLLDVEAGDRVPVLPEVLLGTDRQARRHAVLEAVPHHVDAFEVDRRQVEAARREVGGDGGVVLRAGEDRDRQRYGTLSQAAVLGLLVGAARFQDLPDALLELVPADVQDRGDLVVRQIGRRPHRRQELVEIFRRIGDAGRNRGAGRTRTQRLEHQQIGDLVAVHLLGRIGGPPGDEGVGFSGVAQDVPQRLDAPETAGDRHAPPGRRIDRLEIGDAVHVGPDPGDHRGPQKRRDHRVVGAQGPRCAVRDQAGEIRQTPGAQEWIDRAPVRAVEPEQEEPQPRRLGTGKRLGRGERRGRPDARHQVDRADTSAAQRPGDRLERRPGERRAGRDPRSEIGRQERGQGHRVERRPGEPGCRSPQPGRPERVRLRGQFGK